MLSSHFIHEETDIERWNNVLKETQIRSRTSSTQTSLKASIQNHCTVLPPLPPREAGEKRPAGTFLFLIFFFFFAGCLNSLLLSLQHTIIGKSKPGGWSIFLKREAGRGIASLSFPCESQSCMRSNGQMHWILKKSKTVGAWRGYQGNAGVDSYQRWTGPI